MELILTFGQDEVDASSYFDYNVEVFDSVARPEFWDYFWSATRRETALRNFHAANNFSTRLKQAEERIHHTCALLRTVLTEMDDYVQQCRKLDRKQRQFLKELFSTSTIRFQQVPHIDNRSLLGAIRDRLTTRWHYLEQLLSEVRYYNDIVRGAHEYFVQNVQTSLLVGTYLDGFPSEERLPQELPIS